MTSPSEEQPAAMELYFAGDKPVTSRGGYVVQLIVPFDEIEMWRAIAKNWTPDNPISFAVARIAKPTKIFDPKAKEWVVAEG